MPVFCSACDTSNSRDARFCTECGADLAAEPTDGVAHSGGADGGAEAEAQAAEAAAPAPSRRRRTRGGAAASGDAVDRAFANRELGKAMRVLGRVKQFYVVLALCTVVWGLVLALAAWQLDDPEVGPWLWLLAASQGVLSVLLVIGALQLKRNPFLWSLVLAAIQTLNFATALAISATFPAIDLVLAIACWGAVSMLTNVNRLLKKYPELRAAKKIRGEHKAPTTKGRIGTELAKKRVAERRRRIVVAGCVAGALVLLIASPWIIAGVSSLFGSSDQVEARSSARVEPREYLQPDTPLDPVLQKLEAAWRARDAEALGALYPRRLASRGPRLGRRITRDMPHYPDLGSARVAVAGDNKKKAFYRTEDGPVTVVFQYEENAWVMVALRFRAE